LESHVYVSSAYFGLVASLMLAGAYLAGAGGGGGDAAKAGQAQKQLAKLAAAFHTARCKFDPLLFATANGDSRYDDQIGLAISPKVRAAQFTLYRTLQKQLMAVNRSQLGAHDQLTYDLLTYELNNAMQMESFPDHLLPLNQMDNVPSIGQLRRRHRFAAAGNGQAVPGLPEPPEPAAGLDRPGHRQYARRHAQGVVHPKAITAAMLPQLQNLRALAASQRVLLAGDALPGRVLGRRQETHGRLPANGGQQLAPALNRLVSFLENEYLPAGRSTSGWSALPNGAAWYAAHIKDSTNLPLRRRNPRAGPEGSGAHPAADGGLAPKLGYDGRPTAAAMGARADLVQHLHHRRAGAGCLPRHLRAGAGQAADLLQPDAEGRLELHLEPELTRATASDHYTPSAADGSHPGVFWPVVNDPKQYSRVDMVSLFLHEGVPGHHLHAALLKEIDLPDFRKFSTENPNSAAFTEGWALYSETLGKEMGLYEDPVAYYGHLNAEMLRAARLVVDTGMHAKGWTREQAISYLSEVLGWDEARATRSSATWCCRRRR
jgi:uncharacterized protein (DUF885 family)